MLYLKSSNAVVGAGQTGVDAGNLTLHVQRFVHVSEATMIRQGRLQSDDGS